MQFSISEMTSWAKKTVNRCIARVFMTKSFVIGLQYQSPGLQCESPSLQCQPPYLLKPRLIMSGLWWVIRGFIVSSVFFSYCSIENAVKSIFVSPRVERVWKRASEGLATTTPTWPARRYENQFYGVFYPTVWEKDATNNKPSYHPRQTAHY